MTGGQGVDAAVRRYYERVDAGDVGGVLDCFADDAAYHRPGYEPMVGRAALAAGRFVARHSSFDRPAV